jgi:microcystin-dependent protein
LVAMNPAMVGLAGSSQSHSNLQPTTVINFCVALQGVYPSRP